MQDYFTRFGYVYDVYMPRDKIKRSEHRGFGFVTFETEAAVQRVAQHGPHQIKYDIICVCPAFLPSVMRGSLNSECLCRGSIIAIDSAVPRREEAPSSEEAEDCTPTAATAGSGLGLSNYSRAGSILSPTASGEECFHCCLALLLEQMRAGQPECSPVRPQALNLHCI